VENLNLEPEIRRIDRPTLAVTGEPGRERGVPVGITREYRQRGARGGGGAVRVVPVQMPREYLQLVPQAKSATIPRTGHLGLVTRSEVFSDLIPDFAGHTVREGDRRRRVG